jgi:hypothetical protein
LNQAIRPVSSRGRQQIRDDATFGQVFFNDSAHHQAWWVYTTASGYTITKGGISLSHIKMLDMATSSPKALDLF